MSGPVSADSNTTIRPLRLINEMSLALNISLGERPSFDQALSRLLEGMDGSRAVMLAMPAGAGSLEMVAFAGRIPEGQMNPAALSRFFQEMASSVDLVPGKLAEALGFHPEIASSGIISPASTAYIVVTLKSRRRPVGLLFLEPFGEEGPSDEYALLLSALGFQLGAALENSWLFEEVDRAREAWQATFDAMEEVIVVTDARGRFLQANRPFLQLLEERGCRTDLTAAKELFFREVLAPSGLYPPVGIDCLSREDVEGCGRCWRVSMFPASDPSGTYVYVVRDVTVEKRLREVEDLNRQLAEVNRMKSRIMARVSHDLKTPLNAIIGFSEVLLHGDYGEVNERQERYLRKINESGRHLLDLINDVLDLARLEVGRLELRPGKVEVGSLAEATLGLFEDEARRKGVMLHFESPPAPLDLRADEKRLRQVLCNLLSNAVKFAGEGGSAGVKVGRVEDGVLVEVWDTGMGIPAEKHDLIFEEFIGTGTTGGEGSGLGLAIARQLVELHGGKIWVESAEGKGTSFFFTIPVSGPPDCLDGMVTREGGVGYGGNLGGAAT